MSIVPLRGLAPLAVALLAACAGSPPPDPTAKARPAAPPGSATVYTCADGFRFSVRPRGDSVVLSLPERTATLPQVPAASGAKYSANGTLFWSKGERATLEAGGASRPDCRGRPAGTPWEEATRLGIDFRALGQEPGWVLDLNEGRWLRYIGDYGATRVFATAPQPRSDTAAGSVTYRAQSEGRDLVVEIRESPCQDAMSGESFTHRVTVRLDGQEVEGCGRTLLSGDMTNRYWKLIELDGKPALVGQGAREAHLQLREEGSQAMGSPAATASAAGSSAKATGSASVPWRPRSWRALIPRSEPRNGSSSGCSSGWTARPSPAAT